METPVLPDLASLHLLGKPRQTFRMSLRTESSDGYLCLAYKSGRQSCPGASGMCRGSEGSRSLPRPPPHVCARVNPESSWDSTIPPRWNYLQGSSGSPEGPDLAASRGDRWCAGGVPSGLTVFQWCRGSPPSLIQVCAPYRVVPREDLEEYECYAAHRHLLSVEVCGGTRRVWSRKGPEPRSSMTERSTTMTYHAIFLDLMAPRMHGGTLETSGAHVDR